MFTQKYLDRSRQRMEKGLPLGDMCEYCHSQDRQKDNSCGKCGAPMKPLLGTVFGIPIEEEDLEAAQEYTKNMTWCGTATAGWLHNK